MTFDETSRRVLGTCNMLILAALLFAVSATTCLAQSEGSEKKTALTVKYLIGDAVSLSNQKYPEIEDAIKRFNNQDGKGAMAFLERAKKKYSKLPPANLMMAKMQLLYRNSTAVRILLERTIIDNPEDPDAYLMLADQAYRGNRTTEAYALFKLVEPLVNDFNENAKRKRNFEIRLLAGLSAVAERRNEWDKSYQLLTKWVDIDEENAVAHARLGLTLFRLKKPKEARASFVKARELNSNLPHPYISLARLFSQDGDDETARKSYERAYKEEGGNESTAQAYAEWLILQGELDKAQKVAAALRKQAPDSISALVLDGVVAYMKGDPKRAEQAFQKVLSLEPRHARATDLIALLLIESDKIGDQERALSYAQLNAERFPDNAQANITKAWVLYKLGRKAEARQALQKGAQSGQLQADSMFLIAKIMVAEGQQEKAIDALERGTSQKAGLFVFRNEAKALLEKIKAETGS
ncbi:MAG: tetratricopeptide repeat protein [Pirellulales bacterium]|nr:tetratricopeptide repeat protein [Pirellulales bacterium]